jgi:hypothetical protein
MATPRKLPDVAEQLLSYVRAGNSPYASARAVGLSKATWYSILRRGREGSDPQYATFVEELEAARANAKVSLLTIVRAAAPRDWRAASWLLERLWPQQFGRRDRVELQHEVPRTHPLLEESRREHLKRLDARAKRVEARLRAEAGDGEGSP